MRVAKRYHFSYEDGTPFFPMGTTAYAWTYRPEEVRRRTLESFSRYGFNKIRMLFFPKHYGDGKNVDVSYVPPAFPFEGEPGAWDRRRFVPAYFRNFEDRVGDLCDRGIEADVILYHFYDFGTWGIDEGWSREDDRRYLDYLVARLAPYRNVWWSLANEYDLVVDRAKGTTGERSRIGRTGTASALTSRRSTPGRTRGPCTSGRSASSSRTAPG